MNSAARVVGMLSSIFVGLLLSVSVNSGIKHTVFCHIQVLSVFRKVFGEDFEPYTGSRQFHITPLNLQVSPTLKAHLHQQMCKNVIKIV